MSEDLIRQQLGEMPNILLQEFAEKSLSDDASGAFSLTQSKFKESLFERYKQFGIEPNYLIQFVVGIPFYLGLSPNDFISFPIEPGAACTLAFATQRYVEAYLPFDIAKYYPIFHKYHSIVEMSYISQMPIDVSNQGYYSDILFKALNDLGSAYKSFGTEPGIFSINNQSVHFLSIYRVIHTPNWTISHSGPFFFNLNIPKVQKPVGPEESSEIMRIAHALFNSSGNPFNLSEEALVTADQYCALGQYREGIIYSQMSVESFFRTLYSLFLKIEGLDPAEIEAKLVDIPFLKIITRETMQRLGGRWDITDMTTNAAVWYVETYMPRNRIIHGGFRPNLDHARQAYNSAQRIRGYAIERIHSNSNVPADIRQWMNPHFRPAVK